MWQKLWYLEHLIKLGVFGVWCAKCAKYLAFGTFTTSSVNALSRSDNFLFVKVLIIIIFFQSRGVGMASGIWPKC